MLKEDNKGFNNENGESIVWNNVLAFALSWAIWVPFQDATHYYNQPYLIQLGATPFIISLISSISIFVLSISRIFGGYLSDTSGRKKWIVSMTFFIALSYFLMGIAPDWKVYLIATIIFNIALFYQPAINAILSDSLPKKLRGRGITTIHFISALVSLASPFIALHFIQKYGLVEGERSLFFLAFITGVIAWLIRVVLLREVIKPKKSSIRNLSEYLKDIKEEYEKTISVLISRAKPYVLFLSFIAMVRGMIVLSQLYVLSYLKVAPEQWTYVMFLYSLLGIILMIPSGIIIDKIGRRMGIILQSIGMIGFTLFLYMAGDGSPFLYVLIGYLFFSISITFRGPTFFSITSDILPSDKRAKGFAILTAILGIISSISSILGGYVYEKIDCRAPFLIALLLSLFALLAAIRFKETL